jgi:integrase
LKDVAATKADKTVQGYTKDLSRFTASCSKQYVDEIDKGDLENFVRSLRADGLGHRSVFNVFQSVNTWLRVNGIMAGRPILKQLGRQYVEPEVTPYTHEDISAIFGACDEDERLIYKFFLYSGCREQEVAYTEWTDLDFKSNTLHVHGKPHRNWQVKDKEGRHVPMPQDIMAELQARQGNAGKHDLVFPNADGNPEGHFLRKLQDIVKNAGLDIKVGLHRFRKTFASWHCEAGESVVTLMDWLGHSDLATTQRYLKGMSAKSAVAQQAANRTFATVGGTYITVTQQTAAVQ